MASRSSRRETGPFGRIHRANAVDLVTEALRNAILDGVLEPGDRLPSERELAARFGVNRSTLREAIRRLDTLGLVQVRHGGATVVADFLYTAGLQLLPFLIQTGGRVDTRVVSDLLELRVMLLEWTARKACERADERDIAERENLLQALRSASSTSERKHLDFRFFEVLVRATGNRVLRLTVNVIRKVYLEGPPIFDVLYGDETFATREHERLLAAVRHGDPEEAARAMGDYARSAVALFERTRESLAEEGGQ